MAFGSISCFESSSLSNLVTVCRTKFLEWSFHINSGFSVVLSNIKILKSEMKKFYKICRSYAFEALSLSESAKIVGRKRTIKRVHRGPVNLSLWSLAKSSAARSRVDGGWLAESQKMLRMYKSPPKSSMLFTMVVLETSATNVFKTISAPKLGSYEKAKRYLFILFLNVLAFFST